MEEAFEIDEAQSESARAKKNREREFHKIHRMRKFKARQKDWSRQEIRPSWLHNCQQAVVARQRRNQTRIDHGEFMSDIRDLIYVAPAPRLAFRALLDTGSSASVVDFSEEESHWADLDSGYYEIGDTDTVVEIPTAISVQALGLHIENERGATRLMRV